MVLTIDIGNSRIKLSVFQQHTLIYFEAFSPEVALKKMKNIFNKFPNCSKTVLSSVGKLDIEVFNFLKSKSEVELITHETPFPFKNLYATPKTLGIDRMVLAAGAAIQFPKKNKLVIDAGSCITYDLITAQNEYLGGAISPGFNLRYASLHQFTANLPLLNRVETANFIGNSTENAIQSGVINGISFEIDGFISHYTKDFEDLTIILTGGDADFLAKRLKNTIFANSNFLLESLNLLSLYINEND